MDKAQYEDLKRQKARIEEKMREFDRLSGVAGKMETAIEVAGRLQTAVHMSTPVVKLNIEFQGHEKNEGTVLDLSGCCITLYSFSKMIQDAVRQQQTMIRDERDRIELPK
jgi:hypothetical protein